VNTRSGSENKVRNVGFTQPKQINLREPRQKDSREERVNESTSITDQPKVVTRIVIRRVAVIPSRPHVSIDKCSIAE
jgi:hypothetical protein